MKANPKDYAEKKTGVICNPPILSLNQNIKNEYIGNNISFGKG